MFGKSFLKSLIQKTDSAMICNFTKRPLFTGGFHPSKQTLKMVATTISELFSFNWMIKKVMTTISYVRGSIGKLGGDVFLN